MAKTKLEVALVGQRDHVSPKMNLILGWLSIPFYLYVLGCVVNSGYREASETYPLELCVWHLYSTGTNGGKQVNLIPDKLTGVKAVSFSSQGSCYQVETRARVVIFDIAAFETEKTLTRRQSSLVSHSGDQPHKPLSREHGGLMSWPEHFFPAKQHKQNPDGKTYSKTNSLSAKAMQLSIFGTDDKIRPGSFSNGSQARPARTAAYARAQSYHGYPLPTSARPEGAGAATKRKKLEFSKSAGQMSPPRSPRANTNEAYVQERDNSSDESGDDEIIVRIDSPSTLSFRQVS